MLVKMLDAGMNIARLNFSHGDHTSHGKSLDNLREALTQRPGKSCAVMRDTKGPEIRTGVLKDGKAIELTANQTLKICTDYAHLGDNTMIACSYKSLMTTVQIGSTIFIADGSLTCEVSEINDVSKNSTLQTYLFFDILGSYCCYLLKWCQAWREKEHEPPRSYR